MRNAGGELPRIHIPRTSVNKWSCGPTGDRGGLLRTSGDKGIKKGRIGERSGPRGIPAALGGGFHEAFATSARNQVWKEGMV
jgi:hypothetical protein